MMLAIRPELVRTDKLADDRAPRNPGWEVIPAPRDTIPASGVLWRASKSNEAAGRRLLELAVGNLRGALKAEFGAPVKPQA